MSTIQEAFTVLSGKLAERYADRESVNIAKVVFLDLLGIHPKQAGELTEYQQNQLAEATRALMDGFPVQQVTGIAWFYGRKFVVNEEVLLPRPETEELVHLLLQNHPDDLPLSVLDIGTGSGCIPITLKLERPHWMVGALEVSSPALGVAGINAWQLSAEIEFHQADFIAADFLDSPFGKRNWDVLISNPPYIPERERSSMDALVTDYEPNLALFVPDADPLIFYRRMAVFGKQAGAKALYAECHVNYAQEVAALWRSMGWSNCQVHRDLQGKERMVSSTAME